MSLDKPVELIWMSHNEVVARRCGRYGTITEACADIRNAEANLLAEHLATPGTRAYNDIKAGRFRAVGAPIESQTP